MTNSSPASLSKAGRILGTLQRRDPLGPALPAIPRPPKTLAAWSIFSRMEQNGAPFPTPPSSCAAVGRGGAGPASMVRAYSSSAGEGSSGETDRFQLSPTSVFRLQKGDISVWSVDGSTDAIVNAANKRMLGGGGVDGAIHRGAGPELRAACLEIPAVQPGVRCPTGEARITPAFQLPVSRIIHTVGPIYDADDQSEVSLRSAYRSCLRLAKENSIQYIAFPAISCGVYGYPYKEASRVAISEVKKFSNDFKEVHFVLFMDDLYKVWLETARELLL